MKSPLLVPSLPVLAAVAGLLGLFQSDASATSYTWDAASGNFSTASNWTNNTGPASGGASDMSLIFSAIQWASGTDDYSGSFLLNSLLFTGSTTSTAVLSSTNTGTLAFMANSGTNPTLTINSIGNRPTISAHLSIATSATLVISGDNTNGVLLNGGIAGAGTLEISGSNFPVFLNASDSYTGGTIVDSTGNVAIASSSLGTGTLTLNGGIIRAPSNGGSISNAVSIAANVQFGTPVSASAFGTLTLAGATTLQGTGTTYTVTVSGSWSGTTGAPILNTPVIMSGAIGDGGGGDGLAITGTGSTPNILLINGSSSNTYTGATTVNSLATVQLGKTGGATAIAGNLTVAGGYVQLEAANQIAAAKNLSVSSGTFDLQTFNQTVANVQMTGGAIVGTGTLSSTNAYDMQSGTASANLAGAVGLNKTTSGTVTLAGNDTYTGATSISAGSLLVASSGSISSSSVTVSGGATLGAGGAVTGGTTLSTLNLTTLTLNAGSTLRLYLNPAGATSDLITTPILTIGGSGIILSLNATSPSLTGATYTLLTWSNTSVNNIVGDFSVSFMGSGTPSGYTLTEADGASSNSLELVQAVPEPSTLGMTTVALLGVTGFCLRRRRTAKDR